MKLQGKVAIVTGAARGIGRASAIRFAQEGAKVTVADVRANLGPETVRMIETAGGTASFALTDVSREEDVRKMVEATVERWGRVDILFNNAGYAQVKLVEDTTEAEWDHLLAVNLKSVFFGVKYAVPVMRRQGGGVILNMGSISGLVGQMLTAWLCGLEGRGGDAHQVARP